MLSFVLAATLGLVQTPGSHIRVTNCEPHRHAVGYPGHPWIDPYGNYHGARYFPGDDGFLAITYVNERSVPATEVEFGLVARGWLIAVVRDAGKFSPGVAIDHEFSLDPEVFPIGTALPQCPVLRVKYADGSEWRNSGVND